MEAEVVRAAVAHAAKGPEAVDGEARVIISADKGALHGAVVRVIDLVRGAGATRFAIHVEKER